MPRPLVRWQIYNPFTAETLDFPANPTTGGLPHRSKKYSGQTSTAGMPVIFQGPDALQEVTLTGFILTEEHEAFLNNWYDEPQHVRITDHLGRVFYAWCVDLDIVPRNRTNNEWSANYTLKYLHLGWAD